MPCWNASGYRKARQWSARMPWRLPLKKQLNSWKKKKVQAKLASDKYRRNSPGRPVASGRHVRPKLAWVEIEDIYRHGITSQMMGLKPKRLLQLWTHEPSQRSPSAICRTPSTSQKKSLPYPHTSSSGAMGCLRLQQGPQRYLQVYSVDTDDATHSHQFHQTEDLLLEEHFYGRPSRNASADRAKDVWQNVKLSASSSFPFTELCWGRCFLLQRGGADVMHVRRQVGSKSWEPVWFTHACLRWVALIQQSIQDHWDLVRA